MRNVVVTVMVLGAIGACLLAISERGADPTLRTSRASAPRDEVRAVGNEEVAERHFFRGEYEQAASSYRMVLLDRPEDGLAWARLAYATHELGRFEDALVLHERAAGFEENRVASLFKIACALARLGRAEEAFEALGRAVDGGYRDRKRAEQEADLEPLREHERFAFLLNRMGPPPPGRSPLDFWSGHWMVRDAESGRIIGQSSISRVEEGHLFVEHWTGYSGETGRGMTYLDPADGRWKMLRVDSEGEIQRLEGSFQGGALRLSGERIGHGGRTSPVRAVIEPLADARVHQAIRASQDGGETWIPLTDDLLVHEEGTWYGNRRMRP